MLKDKLWRIISIAIGAAGFLSALVTMFINTATDISIKWLVFLCWIFATIAVVLLSIIMDMVKEREKTPSQLYEKPLRMNDDGSIIIIKKNDNFTNNIIVGCYLESDEIEKLACIAYVYHTQEKLVQLKIWKNLLSESESKSLEEKGVHNMIIRPNIPYDLFLNLGDASNG